MSISEVLVSSPGIKAGQSLVHLPRPITSPFLPPNDNSQGWGRVELPHGSGRVLSLLTQTSSPRFLITFPPPQDFFPINLPATAGSGELETLQTLSPFQVSPPLLQISLWSLFGSGLSLG